MLFQRAINGLRTATAAAVEGGNWDLIDFRTGKLISAGTRTDTGENVTPETALGYHAWYRAISLIAQKSAAVPRALYEPDEDKEEGVIEATEENVHRLVSRRANDEQSAFQFWLQMTGHVASRGNGYAAIYRSGQEITELIPLDPDKTKPIRKDGALWYLTFPFGYNGDGYKYRAKDILHFKGFGFDGLVGYPVWQVAMQELGIGKASRKLQAVRYKNSGRPSMILSTDMKLDKMTAARVRNEWSEMQEGIDNAGKVAVLSGGLQAKAISLSPAEMDTAGASQMSLAAISNYTGVPISKIGGTKSYASQEQEDRSFINDGLDFYLNLTDDEVTQKLLTEEEQKSGMFVRSDREALLRPDIQTKFNMLRIATAGRAFLTPNEARAIIDYPADDEDDSGKLLTPLNMSQGGEKNSPNDNADEGAGRPAKDDSSK